MRGIAAGSQHIGLNATRASQVGIGQVGHGELTQFGVAGIGKFGQLLLPVPYGIAVIGCDAKLVVQADLGNAVHIAQAFFALKIRVSLQAALKGGNDLCLGQAQSARPAHREDEREAKARVVVAVELLEMFKLRWGALGETCLVLLVGGLSGQTVADHGLAGQLRVRAQQVKLCLQSRAGDHPSHGMLELRQRFERSLCQRLLNNPG